MQVQSATHFVPSHAGEQQMLDCGKKDGVWHCLGPAKTTIWAMHRGEEVPRGEGKADSCPYGLWQAAFLFLLPFVFHELMVLVYHPQVGSKAFFPKGLKKSVPAPEPSHGLSTVSGPLRQPPQAPG